MAYSAQDFHDAFARAPGSPAVAVARDLLLMADAARNDPRYPAFEHRVGPDAARRHVLDSGLAALSDNTGGASYTASEPTQAETERKTANALQALFPHASAERVGTRAPEVLARLGRGQQLRLATSDAGTAAAIVQSVLHVDPNAARLRAAQKTAGGDGTRGRGDSEHSGHAGKRERGAFARDRFGHIHSDQSSSSNGSGSGSGSGSGWGSLSGSSRGYAGMGSVWNPSGGIAGLTPNNFIGSPFHQAGLTLPETQELARKYGFTPGNIIKGANDAKSLGFDPKDKDTVKDHAMIRTYDNKPDETMAALREKKDSEQKDLPRLRLLLHTLDAAKPGTSEHTKAAAAVASFHKEHTSPKFAARMADPNNKPPSKQGAKNSDRKLEVQAERKARALQTLERRSEIRANAQVAQAKGDRASNASAKGQTASLLDESTPKGSASASPVAAQPKVAKIQTPEDSKSAHTTPLGGPTKAAAKNEVASLLDGPDDKAKGASPTSNGAKAPAKPVVAQLAPAAAGAQTKAATKNEVASLLETPGEKAKGGATAPATKLVVAQLQPPKGAKPAAGPKVG